ncbi:hypothetical protein BGX31_008961 [Mortierella sp. GBA43]|nr:hypothetical protein BGX31_008961 [Mortierella sp. GBA43]
MSLHEMLQLTEMYLEIAHRTDSNNVALVLCHHAEVALSQAKGTTKKSFASDLEDQVMKKKIAAAFFSLGTLLENRGYRQQAETFYKKCKKLGGHVPEPSQLSGPSATDAPQVNPLHLVPSSQVVHRKSTVETLSADIFSSNWGLSTRDFKPPELDSRLNDTSQLASCLALLQAANENQLDDLLSVDTLSWIQLVKNEPDEHERLKSLATDVIQAFKKDEFKDAKAITEVVCLAPVLEKEDYRHLFKTFYSGMEQLTLLDVQQLEGLAQLIQGADSNYVDADDLVKILDLLGTRLQDTHQQSPQQLYQLTLAVSSVLDAMADATVVKLDQETIHGSLTPYLDGLKASSDPFLVYQAAYAYQTLMYVHDDEPLWQTALRRPRNLKGTSGLTSAVKHFDLNGFIEGLDGIQRSLPGVSEEAGHVQNAYEGALSLVKGGQSFLECLKESFVHKSAWYPALRGADIMIQEGQFADLRKLVWEAPCRRNVAFQWGVCQRLGDIAAGTTWDSETRQGAMMFLAEIYKDDTQWGHHIHVKQWILDILMHLSSGHSVAEYLLSELQNNGDASKQALYRSCRDSGLGSRPSKVGLPAVGSPSLLDRVQERPDVEGKLRQLRRQRLKERGSTLYIPAKAKASLKSHDAACFSLMDKVNEFLEGEQTVFLLLGDSGAGKSTFNKELECDLWQRYKGKTGAIPLHVNLPAIDKPEHDLIAKQLRRLEFTEPQIRDLKQHRTFILICDGYDESQQTHNLYTSNRLNQPGEWTVKMVISCRSEYLGADYQDRFQPEGLIQGSNSSLFQEAVITPFSQHQVKAYIDQYVSLNRPLWNSSHYKRALYLIPSLRELVKNPFLMTLSLEVLPRMLDQDQNLSATYMTRVALYDQFIENWLESSKTRLRENLNPQSRAAFENLIDDGFTRNGIAYLKKLSVAIYKEQGGYPIVSYSRFRDETTWKAEFFSQEDEKQLLREACPLIRSGNQHQFIHKSLLEYGVSLAICDPQEWKEGNAPESAIDRRGSTGSVLSFVGIGAMETPTVTSEIEPGLDSPLAWRSFVNEPLILQFLEERVQQEPLFKQQLLDYIELSKTDKKWRVAAANAITILVRHGFQFNHADLRGIQIPGADLSNGVFDSAQLQGADLRQTALQGAWLGHADLSNAQLAGVQFGTLHAVKDGAVDLLDPKVGKPLEPTTGQPEIIKDVQLAPEGDQTALAGHGRTVPLWDASSDYNKEVLSIKISPKGGQIVTSSTSKVVRVWSIETGSYIHILNGHEQRVKHVAYSPQGDYIATASNDLTVKLWDMRTRVCLYTLTGHTGFVSCVAFSPCGSEIASCGDDSTIRLWNIDTKNCRILEGHRWGVWRVTYSPRGNMIASSSADSTVRLWDVATGECQRVITGHEKMVSSIMFSPSGEEIASGCFDGLVRRWNIETGECLQVLTGHGDAVVGVLYSPGGDMIASGSRDMAIRLWDTASGQCRLLIDGIESGVNDIDWVKISGTDYLAAGCQDGSVMVWKVAMDGDQCQARVYWRTSKGGLGLKDANIRGAQGLSPHDVMLLKERGAVGEFGDRQREKWVGTLSAVSESEAPLREAAGDEEALGQGDLVEQLEQRTEQVKDTLFRDLLTAYVRDIHGCK